MTEPAVVAALVAVAGGVLAVTARDGRTVALGLVVAIAAAPLAASPLPGALGLVARIAGAMLAADLLWVATRVKAVRSEGSAIGVAAETAIAAAAFAVGMYIAPVKPLPGPATEQAAGLALIALALVPLSGRDVLRAGVGAALLAVGLSLLHEAWLGPARSLENLAVAALLVAILGATSLLMAPTVEVTGDVELDLAKEWAPATGRASAIDSDEAAEAEAAPAAAAAEAAPSRPSHPVGSTVRRTRHPRDSEPRT